MVLDLPSIRQLLVKERSLRTYSTGCFMLDCAIGAVDPKTGLPGLRERSVVECFGPNQTGKTMLLEQLAKSVLEADPENQVFLLLSEEPNFERMEAIGLDLDRVFIWTYGQLDDKGNVQMANNGLKLIIKAISDPNSKVKLVGIDSIKSLVDDSEIFDKPGKMRDYDENDPVAIRAKMVNKFLKFWIGLNKADAILFMTNQISESIGPSYMVGENFKTKTSGGRAKEHHAFVRISCQSTMMEEDEKHPVTGSMQSKGLHLFYSVQKNKYSRFTGNRKAVTSFLFEEGRYLREEEVLSMAAYLEIIEVAGGGFYTILGEKVRGRDAAARYLYDNPKVQKELEKEIVKQHESFFRLKTTKLKTKETLDKGTKENVPSRSSKK